MSLVEITTFLFNGQIKARASTRGRSIPDQPCSYISAIYRTVSELNKMLLNYDDIKKIYIKWAVLKLTVSFIPNWKSTAKCVKLQ